MFTARRSTNDDYAQNGENFLLKLYGGVKAKVLDHVQAVDKEDISILSYQTGNITPLVGLSNTSQTWSTI